MESHCGQQWNGRKLEFKDIPDYLICPKSQLKSIRICNQVVEECRYAGENEGERSEYRNIVYGGQSQGEAGVLEQIEMTN